MYSGNSAPGLCSQLPAPSPSVSRVDHWLSVFYEWTHNWNRCVYVYIHMYIFFNCGGPMCPSPCFFPCSICSFCFVFFGDDGFWELAYLEYWPLWQQRGGGVSGCSGLRPAPWRDKGSTTLVPLRELSVRHGWVPLSMSFFLICKREGKEVNKNRRETSRTPTFLPDLNFFGCQRWICCT